MTNKNHSFSDLAHPPGIPYGLQGSPTILLLFKDPGYQPVEIARRPTQEQISQLVRSEPWKAITFVVVQIDEKNFLECSGSLNPEDGLSARYCVEGKEYISCQGPDSLETCINLLASYNQKDSRWLNLIDWCDPGSTGNLARITEALGALVQRTSDDAFVIFEDRASGKFVQFAGSSSEDLLLDLPVQALSEEEVRKAIALFREFDPDSRADREAGEQISIQINFGRDANRAAEACLAIFERVYGFPADFELDIEEN